MRGGASESGEADCTWRRCELTSLRMATPRNPPSTSDPTNRARWTERTALGLAVRRCLDGSLPSRRSI